MVDQSDYTAVANALMAALKADISADVPGWAQGMIPPDIASKLAGSLAKISVDALDAHRANKGD